MGTEVNIVDNALMVPALETPVAVARYIRHLRAGMGGQRAAASCNLSRRMQLPPNSTCPTCSRTTMQESSRYTARQTSGSPMPPTLGLNSPTCRM
eukprot:1320585-Prymnesium_polylepis.1